jgi:hypothetical protein
LILCGQIHGPGLGRHGPKKARRGLGSGWATVFILRTGTARPKNHLGFAVPNPFGTKHDGLGPGWPDPAQFPALARRARRGRGPPGQRGAWCREGARARGRERRGTRPRGRAGRGPRAARARPRDGAAAAAGRRGRWGRGDGAGARGLRRHGRAGREAVRGRRRGGRGERGRGKGRGKTHLRGSKFRRS